MKVGIYDALELCKQLIHPDYDLLAVAHYFWSPIVNAFLFAHGPMTPTIMDISAFTGLCPHGIAVNFFLTPSD